MLGGEGGAVPSLQGKLFGTRHLVDRMRTILATSCFSCSCTGPAQTRAGLRMLLCKNNPLLNYVIVHTVVYEVIRALGLIPVLLPLLLPCF